MKKILFYSMVTIASFFFILFFSMLASKIVFGIGGEIEKVVETKPLKIRQTNVQDSLDFSAMLRDCLNSGKVSITQPLNDDDMLGKIAKECEKRMTDKTTKITENGKTYQELLNLIE